MKNNKPNWRRILFAALASTPLCLALPGSASAVAAFDAGSGAVLTLSANDGLSVSVTDTLLEVFEFSLGNAATATSITGIPEVNALDGDPPLALQINDSVQMSLGASGNASSSSTVPFSTANASVLNTQMLRVSNPGGSPGAFSLDVSWDWQSALSVAHAGEMAGVSLELVISAFDDQFNSMFDPVVLFSVALDSGVGDLGGFADAGSDVLTGMLDVGENWNLIIDLFAVNGYAQSAFSGTELSVPWPITLLLSGFVVIRLQNSRRCRSR